MMSSEINHGERRTYAKRLRPGDRVLRSMEDALVGPFTVATIRGGDFVSAVGTDGRVRMLWPTDAIVVATRKES